MILLIPILLFLLLLPILFFPKCKHEEQNVDCLIVLGCPTYDDGTMSITQKLRVEKAAEAILKHDIKITNGEVFDVSFPNFIESMAELGFELELVE